MLDDGHGQFERLGGALEGAERRRVAGRARVPLDGVERGAGLCKQGANGGLDVLTAHTIERRRRNQVEERVFHGSLTIAGYTLLP